MKDQINIIFFGPPGAGKGTQAKRISTALNLPHIDTGHLIRKAISNETDLGKEAKHFVESGKLVPDDLIIELIKERLLIFSGLQLDGFLLDGYPRTIPQAEALDKMLSSSNLKITKVINIQASEAELIKRLSARRICSNKNCSAIYNLVTKQPKEANKCDLCSSELYQRKDDTETASLERLKEYEKKTAPLEKYYRDKKLVTDVDGSKDPDEVYNEIMKIIKPTDKK